jgi:hypothetical protein
MEKRPFGRTDMQISVLGFGGAEFGLEGANEATVARLLGRALAATLPGYGSFPFELDADYNIARGIIEKIGVGKIVRRDKMPPLPADVT